MVSAVVALGEQLRGMRMVRVLENNAAAGALVIASSRIQMILALLGISRGYVAQLSASCWVKRAASAANPADAPSSYKPLFTKPDVDGELASISGAPKLRRALRVGERLTGKLFDG